MDVVFWICAMVMFVVVEACTTNLVSIWFAVGALIAGIMAYFNVPETACILAFLLVSLAAIVVFKKFYNKNITPKHEPTNSDRLIGATGTVESDIEPITGVGTVKVYGQLWSAKAEETIEKGCIVNVCAIEGVKLIVRKG